MRYEQISKIERDLVHGAINLYDNAKRFQWDSDFVNESVNKHIRNDNYRKLPRYAQSHVDGALEALYKLHWRNVEFSYEIAGKRLSIRSEEYRKVKPQEVSELWSHTGAFIYIDSPNKLFTKPEVGQSCAK
jgi:hypothetical protein